MVVDDAVEEAPAAEEVAAGDEVARKDVAEAEVADIIGRDSAPSPAPPPSTDDVAEDDGTV